MIGKGIPMSQSNKPRPMKSSCVASLRLVTNCQINSPAGEKFRGHSRPRPRGWLHRVSAGCNAAERRYIALASRVRRGGRVAEGARLESVYTGNRIVGSNPTPSANALRNPQAREWPLMTHRVISRVAFACCTWRYHPSRFATAPARIRNQRICHHLKRLLIT